MIDLLTVDLSAIDVYLIGFQEIVDLNAMNAISDGASAKRTAEWQDRIQICLASKKWNSPNRIALIA